MIDAVFDTNILLQAALSDTGPAYACWEFVEAGAVRVWTTEAAMGELTDVLSRDKLRRKLNAAQPDRAAMILDVFRKICRSRPLRRFIFLLIAIRTTKFSSIWQ